MNNRLWIWSALSVVMIATRFGHMGTAWSLPDASWALFFVGGFYLAAQWRWALSLLMLEALCVDLIAVGHYGVSNYCLTAAYIFNAPAYALLWLGGRWLRRNLQHRLGDIVRLSASAWLSVSACFLITNGSFYWLGGRVSERTLHGWIENFGDWYFPYLANAAIYLALAAMLHLILARRARDTRSWQLR